MHSTLYSLPGACAPSHPLSGQYVFNSTSTDAHPRAELSSSALCAQLVYIEHSVLKATCYMQGHTQARMQPGARSM
eukprot:1149145-Pelagomonas_calceolata.AAC.5